MRKKIFAVVILVTLVLSIVLNETLFASTKLTMSIGTGGLEWSIRPAVEQFIKETGIQVEMINLPYADRREKMLLDFVSRSGKFDIVPIDGSIWMAEMAPFLEPLDLYIKRDAQELDFNDFIPSLVRELRSPYPNGTVYGLPARFGAWITHYRKDLFDAANLEAPTTFNKFLKAAKKLTTNVDGKEQYGSVLAGLQGNFLVAQWVPFLWGYGGELWNKNYTAFAGNSKRGIEATQFMVDLYQEHRVVPPGCVQYEHQGVIVALQQGLAASAITYSPYALDINDTQRSRTVGKWAWAASPYADQYGLTKGRSMISGWGFSINKDSKNKEEAWRLLKYIANKDVQMKIAVEYANGPVRYSTYRDPKYQKTFPAAIPTLNALVNGEGRGPFAEWTAVEDIMASYLSKALSGKMNVKDALAAMEKDVNTIIKKKK